MQPIPRTPGRLPLEVVGLMIGIVATSLVVGLAMDHPGSSTILLFAGIIAVPFFAGRTSFPREATAGKPLRPRFSIWQGMAASVVVAVACVIARALGGFFSPAGPGGAPTDPLRDIARGYLALALVLLAIGALIYVGRSLVGIYWLAIQAGRRK